MFLSWRCFKSSCHQQPIQQQYAAPARQCKQLTYPLSGSLRRHRRHWSLYWMFLSLSSAMILTAFQFKAELLQTRQILEERHASTNTDKRDVRHQYHSLVLTIHLRDRDLSGGPHQSTSSSSRPTTTTTTIDTATTHRFSPSLSWAAACTQSIVETSHLDSVNDHKEFSDIRIQVHGPGDSRLHQDKLLNDPDLLLLMHRLRNRYPRALVQVYVVERGAGKLGAPVLLGPGWSENSPLNMTRNIAMLSAGTWEPGDSCLLFDNAGSVTNKLRTRRNSLLLEWVDSTSKLKKIRARMSSLILNQRSSDKSDEVLSGMRISQTQTATIHNSFSESRRLFLMYQLGAEEDLLRVRINGKPTMEIDPYVSNDKPGDLDETSSLSHASEPLITMTAIGNVNPSSSGTRVELEPRLSAEDAAMAVKEPSFHVLGIGLGVSGAIKEVQRDSFNNGL